MIFCKQLLTSDLITDDMASIQIDYWRDGNTLHRLWSTIRTHFLPFRQIHSQMVSIFGAKKSGSRVANSSIGPEVVNSSSSSALILSKRMP